MANHVDYLDMMDRIVQIEKEATAQADAVGYAKHQQEGFPYWTNRFANLALDRAGNSYGEEATEQTVTLQCTLHVGNASSGYAGERDAELLQYFADISRYFNERPKLQSAVYPDGMRFVHFLECTNVNGVNITPGGAAGDGVFTTVFTNIIHLFEPLQFAYF